MSEPVLEAHVQTIKVKCRDLSRKDEPEKARQSLIDMVEGEIERIRTLAAEHEQNAGEDAVRIRAASRRFRIARRLERGVRPRVCEIQELAGARTRGSSEGETGAEGG